jgi:predicted  nucleic acid-binding Zn-ribbon protein
MKFLEILDMYAEATLDETVAQVISRIKKQRAKVKTASELSRAITQDQALTQSVPAIDTATDQEKVDYAELLKDPVVSQAIDELPTEVKSSFVKISKLETPEKVAEKTPTKPDTLKQIDPQIKNKLSQMQDEWFKSKSSSGKTALVGSWTKEPVKARLYKFGLNQGLFAMPKLA